MILFKNWLRQYGRFMFLGTAVMVLVIVLSIMRANAQTNNVKIYVVKDTMALWDKKYKSEILWGFYKVDMDKKSIQHNSFKFREGEQEPDLKIVSYVFRGQPTNWFEVISPTKIKVKRIKATRTKRAWNDFATSGRSGGAAAQIFFIKEDTLQTKNGRLKFVFDENLTKKYRQEKPEIEN